APPAAGTTTRRAPAASRATKATTEPSGDSRGSPRERPPAHASAASGAGPARDRGVRAGVR
ncbi:MAG TPA: hypothetical protein VM263_03540, partial [Acidimicrobiales bacterium]|nr:hypothetical protein [Acidimicrobiales bacterium]